MYSTKGICYFKCYSVPDLSLLLKKSQKTIFKHIADGLKTIDSHTPYLVRGYDLIEYLKKYNDARRCPTEFNEFYCLSCKEARVPKDKVINLSESAGVMAKAICPECGKIMCKAYKITDWPELKKNFNIADKLSICDSENSLLNFQNSEALPKQKNGKEQLCWSF